MQRIAYTPSYISKLKFKIVHFLVILVLLLLNIWGCRGQPLHSKSILKVVSQMVRLCDYAIVFLSYLHIGFLTFLALCKNYFWDETPCTLNGNDIPKKLLKNSEKKSFYLFDHLQFFLLLKSQNHSYILVKHRKKFSSLCTVQFYFP